MLYRSAPYGWRWLKDLARILRDILEYLTRKIPFIVRSTFLISQRELPEPAGVWMLLTTGTARVQWSKPSNLICKISYMRWEFVEITFSADFKLARKAARFGTWMSMGLTIVFRSKLAQWASKNCHTLIANIGIFWRYFNAIEFSQIASKFEIRWYLVW